MSVDKTLKSKSTLERHRNVLTRAERIAVLKETERWTDGMSVFGLPKIVHRKVSVGKKDKKDATTEGEEATGEGEKKTEESK